MSNNSKISNRTSKNILLGLGAALLIASCAQNEGWEQPSDSGKPNTQPATKPVTKPTPQPEPTPTTNQGQFLGLFAADITTDGQNITSSEVRPLSTGAALENIVLSVDNTINLKDDKTGIKHYLTTLNVINKSNKDIATPTFVPVATSRTNNTFFNGAKDKSGKASDPAGIIIEQGHHNSAGNIVVNPTASKLAAVNFAASSIVPKAGDKITKVSGKAWQSAALAKGAIQKVQLGFMIPKANNTFRFSVLFAVMDSGVLNKAPTADFTYTPSEPVAQQKILFDAKTLSKDVDGQVSKYVFDFGDGSTATTNTTGMLNHAFAKDGTYNVSVYVVDDKGAKSTTVTKAVKVGAAINSKVCIDNYVIDGSDTAGDLAKVKDCGKIEGVLKIHYTRLTNLQALSGLTEVTGDVYINTNYDLKNLNGLKNLTTIGGSLYLYTSANNYGGFTSLEGLESLTTVEGDLEITNNLALANLKGLEGLRTVKGYLKIWNNSNLISVSGLNKFTTVDGSLLIGDNDSLSSFAGLNITSVGKDLFVGYHDRLTNFSGFNIGSVGGYVDIKENGRITSLKGFENLKLVKGYLSINGNNSLKNINALSNVTNVHGNLLIHKNGSLADLTGLDLLASVGGYLDIDTNGYLSNVSALSALKSVGGYLDINDNDNLKSLAGLHNLASLGSGLYIQNNAALNDITALGGLKTAKTDLYVANNSKLASLRGLHNITSVGKNLTVMKNPALPNLTGLDSITSVGQHLYIKENPALTNLAGLDKLSLITKNLYIEDNSHLTDIGALKNLKVKEYKRISDNSRFNCSSYNNKPYPLPFFPVNASSYNAGNCVTR